MNRTTIVRMALLLVLAAAIVAVLLNRELVQDQLLAFFEWVKGLGVWGPVILAAAFTPASLFFVPGVLLTLGAGVSFPLVDAVVAVSLGSTVGASAAFLAGRYIARGWIEKKVSGNVRFQAIDKAVGEQGFKIVLLTRLSPAFPFNLLNYAYGLTNVRFRDYVLASWIGMFPGTVMYVYFGSLLGNVAEALAGKVEKGAEYYALLVVGFVATVAVTILVTRVARRALADAIPAEAKDSSDPSEPRSEDE